VQRKHQSSPPRICSICASSDVAFLTQWESHILPLQQANQISFWSERHILPGASRTEHIREQLDQADYIVLLLSADFFADEDCQTLMQQALRRSRTDKVPLVPLLLRPVTWQETPLGDLACLPSNGKPVTLWEHPDEGFYMCAREMFHLLLGRKQADPSPTPNPIQTGTTYSASSTSNKLHCPQCQSTDLTLSRTDEGYYGYWCAGHKSFLTCPRCSSAQLASADTLAESISKDKVKSTLICLNCSYGLT
jgi:TIR domain